jgi:hypothetical protein
LVPDTGREGRRGGRSRGWSFGGKGRVARFSYTSDIKGSPALRELRVQSRGHPLRVFYALDPLRRAVLLLGGDKTGDDRFYETFVPHAERIWTEYLDDLEEKEKGR